MISSHNGIQEARLYRSFAAMINTYSPSGKEEELTASLYRELRHELSETDCRVELQTVEGTRNNILVYRGDSDQSDFETLLLGHIDTVPAFDLAEFELSEHDGLLYGLGTADMKSGCAALVEAFISAAVDDHLPESCMLALVVGEEENGDGTLALLDSFSFNEAIVAEPSSLKPCLTHYGYLEMLLQTRGNRRHAAFSGPEQHSVRNMLKLLLKIEEFTVPTEGKKSPAINLNIRDLHSSESGFAVPDTCTAAIDLHIAPERDVPDYLEQLEEFTRRSFREIADKAGGSVDISFPTVSSGYRLPADTPLADSLHAAMNDCALDWLPSSFTSHSDANLLDESGCQAIVIGPGDLSRAHSRDEAVSFDQVLSAAKLYYCLLKRLGSA
ncbi:M20 family metallopeptidase [Spirochaeta dissipatitropha]